MAKTKTKMTVEPKTAVQESMDGMKPILGVNTNAVVIEPEVEAIASVKPKANLPLSSVSVISAELQALQRQRAITLKSRNMQSNRLQAVVAGTIGYSNTMAEKDRQKKFREAAILIKQVCEGKAESPLATVIRTTMIGIDAFNEMKTALEKEMVKQAEKLPVSTWVKEKDQRGFGMLFLAIVVGETGDLANYANPGKLWRRLGCAPYTFDGKTLMGATWRGGHQGKLPASEWEAFGYSPRRRSIAYLIGEGIMKQNFISNKKGDESGSEAERVDTDEERGTDGGDYPSENDQIIASVSYLFYGPYRRRYDQSKSRVKSLHPDYSDKRCHLHGMLLATKLLLKNLWCEWNPNLIESYEALQKKWREQGSRVGV